MATDVEVAARFITKYRSHTNESVHLPVAMLVYTLHIYIKGLAYFRQSQYVTVCMGAFVRRYCNRTGVVLELLRDMRRRRRRSINIIVLLKAYHIEKSINEEMGLRDNTHLFAIHHARSHHREALNKTKRL